MIDIQRLGLSIMIIIIAYKVFDKYGFIEAMKKTWKNKTKKKKK